MKFVRILLIFLNKISIFFHFNADPVPGSGARIHSPEKNIRSFALMWIWNPVGWGRLRLQPKWDCFSQCCGARAGAGRSRYFLVGAGGDVKAKTFFYYFLAYFYMKRSRGGEKKVPGAEAGQKRTSSATLALQLWLQARKGQLQAARAVNPDPGG